MENLIPKIFNEKIKIAFETSRKLYKISHNQIKKLQLY